MLSLQVLVSFRYYKLITVEGEGVTIVLVSFRYYGRIRDAVGRKEAVLVSFRYYNQTRYFTRNLLSFSFFSLLQKNESSKKAN